jgi:hypothetical protein
MSTSPSRFQRGASSQKLRRRLVGLSLTAGVLALSSAVFGSEALADGNGPPRQGRGGPPQEAIDACSGKASGDACSVAFHGQTLEGTCRNGPDGQGALACLPARPPGPPPEAKAACDGKSEGATCSVTHGDQTMTGACRRGPDGNGDLVCAPSGPPPGGGRGRAGGSGKGQ